MRPGCALALAILATPAQAACVGQGVASFAADPAAIRLCIANDCEVAVRSRECGNVHYAALDYRGESRMWIFRVRYGDRAAGVPDDHAVLHHPLDPDDIPWQMLDGRRVRLVDAGQPLDRATVQQLRCIPVTRGNACEFIDDVLEKMR